MRQWGFAMQTYGNQPAAIISDTQSVSVEDRRLCVCAAAAVERRGCENVPPDCEAAVCSVRSVVAGDRSGSLNKSQRDE